MKIVPLLVLVAPALVLAALAVATRGGGEPPPRDEFAADRVADFDSSRAMDDLRSLCRIGPRVSGTQGMARQQDLLQRHFTGVGARVELQRFQAVQRSRGTPVDMANIVASWYPERSRRVILCSHYDTRPIADQELDRRKWHEPFLSANDGTSGVALLMEMGRHMKDVAPAVGVDFVFFDGEEYVFDPQGDLYFFGSEHFAKQYRAARPRPQYAGAVLVDMIAGKDARYPIEQTSLFQAPALVEELWQIAAEQKCSAFVKTLGPQVRDDHLALNSVGIPAVDVIDFDYPHWHKLTDTPENCSTESLRQVARVLTAWLRSVR